MKKVVLTLSLAVALILTAVAPAVAATPDDNCRQMLVNKQHLLDAAYVPSSLTALADYMSAGGNVMMTAEAAEAAGKMVAAMKADGLTDIHGQSGYRSYATQKMLNDNKITYYRNQGYGNEQALELACNVVAAPGASEHQTGLAIDFTTSANGGSLTEDFGTTPVGQWLAANSWKYGFVLRYGADKVAITGYIYEPWHFRYVGQPHAEYMYQNELCLEEYYQQLQEQEIITCTSVSGQSYAVRFSEYNNSSTLPADELVSLSRAYPNAPLGFITTTTVPQIALFDITGHWAEACIRNLNALGIISGYPNNTFRPEKNVSRAEMVSMIYRTYLLLYPDEADMEQPEQAAAPQSGDGADPLTSLPEGTTASPFADVPDGAYYLDPLLSLNAKGLVAPGLLQEQANGATTFLPDQKALRREVAQSLAPLFMVMPDIPSSGIVLKDMVDADPDLQAAVQLLVDAGIVAGNPSGDFLPEADISRAEISAMLDRILSFFDYAAEKTTAD